jgi:hypothetical protein
VPVAEVSGVTALNMARPTTTGIDRRVTGVTDGPKSYSSRPQIISTIAAAVLSQLARIASNLSESSGLFR